MTVAVWATADAGVVSRDEPSEKYAIALIPEELVGDLGPEAIAIHDYGAMWLVRFGGDLPDELRRRSHAVPATGLVGFRSWSGSLPAVAEDPVFDGGALVLELIGPMDRVWRAELEAAGIEILAPAHPHALVVRAERAAVERALRIETSEGFPVIREVGPLPVEARAHRSLRAAIGGVAPPAEIELTFSGYAGRPLSAAAKRASDDVEVLNLPAGDLRMLLLDNPEIGYVEPVFAIELHNNLAARSGLVAVEPVWDFGYSGAGVTVLHNDSGVDPEHPDLSDAVTATIGRMAYSDTAHGTHTAGSIVGRGRSFAPTNSSGCGDLTPGLPTARGMAWGSTLITNNIFEEGYGQVTEMMTWGVDNGAHLSSNSWGLVGTSGPEVGYSAAAVEADAAVRDADPETPGAQPLSIFFSSGNTGPEPGTVTSPGTAKNVITVGAVQNDRCGAWVPGHQPGPDPELVLTGSGRGPSQGRLKPDLVAPGSDIVSAESGDPYAIQPWEEAWTGPDLALNTGTSQACAVAAGAGAVLHEVLWRNRGRRPNPALLKAALVVAANPGIDGVDFGHGWGRVDLAEAATGTLTGRGVFMDQDETGELGTGQRWQTTIHVDSSSAPLGIAVVWTDPPGEEDADHPLVNDLDLVVTSPSGTVYRGNLFSGGWSLPDPGAERDTDNNVEVVRVDSPLPGTWVVEVVGVDVPQLPIDLGGQDFALAVGGDSAPCAEPPPPPDSVTAEHAGPNKIRVIWSTVSGATRYEVWRSANSGGQPYEKVASFPDGVVMYIDTDLSGGSEYYYVVRVRRFCWSDFSAEASATPTGPCVLTPEFAGVESVESPASATCALDLSWAPATRRCNLPVAYDIYRGQDPDFEPDADNRVMENLISLAWSDRGLDGDRDYYYVVRARNSSQAPDDGNTVVRGGRPEGPDDVFLFSGAEVGLDDWIREPASAADRGTEPWGVTGDDAWTGDRSWFVADEDRVKDQVLMTAVAIVLPAATAPILEFHHRYRLERRRDGGRLEYSTNGGNEWHDILEGDGQTVPDDPQRWTAGGYTDTIGAQSNPLFRAESWTGDSRGWVTSRADLSDLAGRRVLLRWRMGCDETPGVGWGWWLDGIRLFEERSCQTCLSTDPPTGMNADVTAEGVALEWPDYWGAEAYRISRAEDSNGPFQILGFVAAPTTTYLDTTASGGTSYTYVIAADNGCWTDDSAGLTVTAGGPCKKAPIFWGLDEVIDPRESGCALDLQWRPASPGCSGAEVGYRIHRSTSPGFAPGPDTLIADGVKGRRFRDTTVVDGGLNHYRVRAVDGESGAEEDNPVVHHGWTTGPQEIHFSDSMEGDLGQWRTGLGSSADSGTEPWGVVDDFAHNGSRSWFCSNEPRIKDQVVGLVSAFDIDDETTVLGFFHLYELEPFWDGGRLEYSTDGGSSWHDILQGDGTTVSDNPNRFLSGPYSGFVSIGTGHPFGGERAWTGFDSGWTETIVELADFIGLTVGFRWRLGCDRADSRVGWWLDDVEVRITTRCETVALPPPREVQGRRP